MYLMPLNVLIMYSMPLNVALKTFKFFKHCVIVYDS